jgi:imidazolonepropionase-like amidohydrolase
MAGVTLFDNCTLLDVEQRLAVPGCAVLIEGERIKEVSDRPIRIADARRIDVRGRTLMPGLCDAHVHVTQFSSSLQLLRRAAPSYVSAQAGAVMRAMLRRGFTTVRDAGGADYGLADAVAEGVFEGPRLLYCGHALSQTGGHGDARERGEDETSFCPSCVGRAGRVCDGVDEVRRAARDELRKGAHQIKLMVNGGVSSPLDRIESTQFSPDEIRAAVEEAEAQDRYVMAHAYTAKSITRALDCGVRSIEHGNMLDEATAEHIVRSKAFLVPTIVVFRAMVKHGASMGLPSALRAKAAEVESCAMRGLEIAARAGVDMAFGTDLFGPMHAFQCEEFAIRAEVQKPIDVIRAATVGAAALFNMTGQVGVVAPGAYADLLVVDGDPLADLNLLQEEGKHLDVIVKAGHVIVNRL